MTLATGRNQCRADAVDLGATHPGEGRKVYPARSQSFSLRELVDLGVHGIGRQLIYRNKERPRLYFILLQDCDHLVSTSPESICIDGYTEQPRRDLGPRCNGLHPKTNHPVQLPSVAGVNLLASL